MEPNYMFIGVVLAICFMGCVTFIIAKIIDRRCKHEWETIQELPVQECDNGNITIAYLYVLRCKKCGDISQCQVKYRAEGI